MSDLDKKCVSSLMFRAEETARGRARGLARLLMFAVLDAGELDCPDAARAIGEAIKDIKSEYGLSDVEILTVERSAKN